MQRVTYGLHPSQYAELSLPDGSATGVAVILHGGFWKALYGLELGRPLAADLTARGWVTWNVEYRRVRGGGGFPETLDDVHSAIEALADTGQDLSRVVTIGHSAGGHLALWAASRARSPRWPVEVPVTHVVSLAGVADLTSAHREDLGSGAVAAFMGGGPDDPAYDLADPMRLLPTGVPVWCVHARDDVDVPFSQSAAYVSRAQAAGDEAILVDVPGGHFGVIDCESSAWRAVVGVLDGL